MFPCSGFIYIFEEVQRFISFFGVTLYGDMNINFRIEDNLSYLVIPGATSADTFCIRTDEYLAADAW